MKPRVAYVFDSLSDVRFVDGFSELFDLTVVYPRGSGGVTNAPRGRFAQAVLAGKRVGFPFRVVKWLINHRDSYEAVLVLGDTTAALGANIAGIFTNRPVVQIEGKQTVEYFMTKKPAGLGLKFWAQLLVLRALLWINGKLATAGAGACDAIVASSPTRRKRAIPWYGIDVAAFKPDVSRSEARRALDLPEGMQILLYRSRIAPEKDPETFLRAAELLARSGRDVMVCYVGGEYQAFLEIASSFKVDVVARGHVHPLDELPLYYRAADVMVQTSKAEGLALSTLEALASEVPVVASATGGMLETIRSGETGLTAPVGDAEAVAEKIAWILDNTDEAVAMARAGRLMVIGRYSSEVAMAGWLQIVRDVLPSKA